MEFAAQRFVDVHDRGIVIELTAIIRRREHSDEIPICEKFKALLDDLMRATNQINLVLLAELLDDGLAEDVGDAALVVGPCRYIIGISPEQVAQKSLIGRVLRLLNIINLGQMVQIRRETAVHAQNTLVNHS